RCLTAWRRPNVPQGWLGLAESGRTIVRAPAHRNGRQSDFASEVLTRQDYRGAVVAAGSGGAACRCRCSGREIVAGAPRFERTGKLQKFEFQRERRRAADG